MAKIRTFDKIEDLKLFGCSYSEGRSSTWMNSNLVYSRKRRKEYTGETNVEQSFTREGVNVGEERLNFCTGNQGKIFYQQNHVPNFNLDPSNKVR